VRVGIVTNVTAPYRTELFAHAMGDLAEMHVYFISDNEPFRTWERRPALPYGHTYLAAPRFSLGSRRLGRYEDLATSLKAKRHEVLVAYGFSLATVRCLAYAMQNRVPFLLACDATPDTDPCKGIEFMYRRGLAAAANGFIASSSLASEYFQLLGASANKITVVELTTDLRQLQEMKELGASSPKVAALTRAGGPLVVVAARFYPDKRILDACRAVVAVARSVPSIQLAIAGDGPQMPDIERWVDRHGDSRIHLLGLLEWNELLALYKASQVMLFPATREKFGMVVLEALACGVPVIAYARSGAARDLIEDGRNGFRVEEGDVEGMAKLLEMVLSDETLLAQMRERAPAVVLKHDVRIEARKFAAAIRKVAATPETNPPQTLALTGTTT